MAVAEEQAGNWWLATVVVLGMPTPPCFAGRASSALSLNASPLVSAGRN